jgi:class 3 adenylate cyclase
LAQLGIKGVSDTQLHALGKTKPTWTPRSDTNKISISAGSGAIVHMVEQRVRRRLAAILAADVVGYSRLMEQDETGTLARPQGATQERVRSSGCSS